MTKLKQIWQLVGTRIAPLLWLIALICAGFEFALARIIQNVTQQSMLTIRLFVVALGAALMIGLGRWLIGRWQTQAQYRLVQRLQTQQMAALMTGPVATDDQTGSERLNGMTTEASLAAPLFIQSVTALAVGTFSFLAASLFGWLSSWLLMVVIVGLCLTALLIPRFMAGRLTQAQDTQQVENGRMQSALLEVLAGRTLLRDYQSEQFGLQLFRKAYQTFADSQYHMGIQQTGTIVLGFALGLFVDIAILGVELWFVGFKMITVGQFAAFAMLTPSFTWLFYSMPGQYAQLSRQVVAAKRLLALVTLPEQKHSDLTQKVSGQYTSASSFSGEQLVLQDLSYTYPSAHQPVLQQLNLTIDVAAHEKILVTGPSGGGKSTLIQIILGLLIPQAGMIQGQPAGVASERLADKIGFVPQVVALFDDTLLQNITLGRPVTQAAIEAVLAQTDLQAFVDRLPQGLTTQLHGQAKANVSAGELQKIGLARALVAKRAMLLLDEPFANLDAASAKALSQGLKSLPIAMMVISHRLDITRFWDRALRLENGRLNEESLAKPK
ncbi:ABC transporter ATP-binding protein/permease [Lacticaseibacillus casei]|uniref:ABC transporter ATP-binding protein n=1 Tax=Lacticaseibacillus huelsenbergensis TaxID=3035291 RepID=A0ABY8DQS4_9LACO|nr:MULTISPECIES: ABC transporter ATP-binding protein [Lacticaseibacillus]MDG3060799.1 ABC transporter ATP-binding protein [Lacticaseibacillus sp. BCRC 81376]QVI37408.1 ABC transporter ATP-binding protein [Lacticaseibacillus casei]QXG59200.1 ABC transporter ATP-binding protein/permease [Lacticaseibacillus casei]WFB39346.1 ABC transporter ATP-binding protein [Lacticaseibacillus huelsenbergensis]WFB41048.1 ABC transporter ATP-binding protein [Lacticaseibacillus huelsenbergensis]